MVDNSIRRLTDAEANGRHIAVDEFAEADRQYNADKTDPKAIARREHKSLTEQANMLRLMSRSM
jgi:hypothetical protein